MELTQLKSQLKSNELNSTYIFTGDEVGVMDIYISQICKCQDIQPRYVDSVSSIYSKITSRSFVSNSYCYVIRDDKEFLTSEVLWEKLNPQELPFDNRVDIGNNIIIFVYTNIDKRSKFYKKFSKDFIVFEHLPSELLCKYIDKQISLKSANKIQLIDVCENDYSRILLEIDKVRRISSICNTTPDEAFDKLINSGDIFIPPKDAIFDFVDSFLNRNINRTFDLYRNCIEFGESNIVLLSVLYTNIKHLLQVQACESNDISASTGLNGWIVKKCKEYIHSYSIGELVGMLNTLHHIDRSIKSGEMEESISVEYFLVNFL